MLGGNEKYMSARIECRVSDQKEMEELKTLWEIGFGDDRTYIDLFFEYKYKENRTYVLSVDNIIAAMVTAIPVNYVVSEKVYEAVMLYAVATRPDERGKGYSTLLMDYVNEDFKNKGFKLSVLVPANKPLIDFYKKRGYAEAFTIYEGRYHDEMHIQDPVAIHMEPVDAKLYNHMRNSFLVYNKGVLYHDEDIGFQKKTAALSGGDLFTLKSPDFTGCAVVERISPERILVKELLVEERRVTACLKRMVEFLPADEVVVRLPKHNDDLTGESRVFGMAMVLDPSLSLSPEGYLGLAFD